MLGASAATGLGLASMALAGCGDDDDDDAPSATNTTASGETPSASPTSSVQEPKKGGTLYVDSGEPAPNALVFAFNANNFYLRWAIWDSVIMQGSDNRPRPALAESFEMRPDFTGVQIKLKPGLEFHDGRPLTAEDVRYSIELFRADETTSQLKAPGKLISDIKIVDPLTLDITFTARRPFMEDYFTLLPIVDENTVGQATEMKVLNGAGAFKFVSYTPNQGYVMEANPNYWDAGKPYLDRIEGRIYSDTQARILALQTGELMHASQITPAMVKALQSSSDVVVNDAGVGGSWYAGLVVDYPGMEDPRVRRALSLAIDRERIASEWGEGVIEPQVQPWPKESPAYVAEDENLLPYDPEQAKSLLQQAGATDLSIAMDIGQGREDLAQYVQDDWKAIGVDAQINVGEYSAYLERFRTRKVDGGAFIAPFGFSDNMHPATFFNFAQPVRIPNASHYESEDYSALLAKIDEIDPHSEEGKEVLREWNKRFLVDDPWIAPLAPNNTFFAMQKNVVAPVDGARDAPPLSEYWIDA